jgi:hypothetical protein
LNKSKFELRAPEVQYVGHVISKDGFKVSPEKVRAIQEMPAPTDVAGVKRVLGVARRFHPIQEYRRLYILHQVDPKTSRALSYKILPAPYKKCPLRQM